MSAGTISETTIYGRACGMPVSVNVLRDGVETKCVACSKSFACDSDAISHAMHTHPGLVRGGLPPRD
jgi:hypothetical protein